MPTLLMSLDLEDARLHSVNGQQYPSRVDKNTEDFVQFLKKNKWPCTFFTVGNIFESHPDLIRMIKSEGFEIAWHSSKHDPVAEMTEDEFYSDVMEGQETASKFGLSMTGYRAPTFSVTASVPWFHSVLKRAGFKYSSSILPAANPLYGWADFGQSPVIRNDILEIPMPLADMKLLKVPFGGVYIRALPSLIFKMAIKFQKGKDDPIATYMHPYDFDYQQERYIHGGINGSAFYNFLMYYNRKNMFHRIEKLAEACSHSVSSYEQFYRSYNNFSK